MSQIDAINFAKSVNDKLGTPNGSVGPFFAYLKPSDGLVSTYACLTDCSSTQPEKLTNATSSNLAYAKASVVPLPAAAWLFMSGLIGLVWKGRKARETFA